MPVPQPHSLELKFGNVFDDVDDVDDVNVNENGMNVELSNVNANNRANPNRNSFINSVNSNNNNMDNDSDNDNNNNNYMDNSIEQSLRNKNNNNGKVNKLNAVANHIADHVNRGPFGQQRNESLVVGDTANVNMNNNRMRNKFGVPSADDNSKMMPNKNKKLDALRRNMESKGAAAADEDGKCALKECLLLIAYKKKAFCSALNRYHARQNNANIVVIVKSLDHLQLNS